MMENLLETTEVLHKYLQTVNIDLSKAIRYKDAVLQTLIGMRNSGEADKLYSATETLMSENNLSTLPAAKRTKKRKLMDDFITDSTTGQREDANNSQSLRTKVYYPTLDRMISEMTARFSPQSDSLMQGIHACCPASKTFMEFKQLKKISTHYNWQLNEAQVSVARNMLKTLQMEAEEAEQAFTMETAYGHLDIKSFPTVKKVFQAALTIPVTSCTCERSFSCMRRVKTWLRAKMTQERLDHLSILSLEKKVYTSCTDDELVHAFTSLKKRRFD